MISNKEAVDRIVKLISELDVLYADAKSKLHCVLPANNVNALYEKFYNTELGETLKPLKKADTLLGEISPAIELFIKGAIDSDEVVVRFNRLTDRRLDGIGIEEYINLVTVYMKAYSSPINTLDDIVHILSAKYINEGIQPC